MIDKINIKTEVCTFCGLCEDVCPIRIMKIDKGSGILFRQDRMPLCIRCGQCLAVCPVQAIRVESLSYESHFFALPASPVADLPFLEMIKTRRAIRAFKDKPVPEAMLGKIVEAISFAPPSFTPLKIELVVVQDTAVIRKALPEMIQVYEGLVSAMSNPIGRMVVYLKHGAEKFKVLKHHVVPLMKSRLPELIQGAEDTITRYAPALILFHAHRDAENYETDINIALTYGFLAAHALGLGGSPIDLIPPAIQNSPALQTVFCIPDENIPVAALILGYPKFKYQRGIKRDLKSVIWI